MSEIISWPSDLIREIYVKSVDGGFRQDILEMILEAYETLKNDHYRSSTILAGETLFRANCEYILWYAKTSGAFEYRNKKKNISLQGDDVTSDFKAAQLLLDNLDIYHSIKALRKLNLINDKTYWDMQALRYLRNQMVHHSDTPRLDPYDEPITTREELEEALSSFDIPLKWRKHQFEIEVDGQKKQYIVDQERLEIDIEQNRSALSIPLSLLFSSMKYVYQQISPALFS